jgi:hypothetical protein
VDVFISSIQQGYRDVREAARLAVETLRMRPLMAELEGGRPESPQRALLDVVGRCDIFLLLVGPRYSRPTEDEFDEAVRLGKTILVLRQDVDLEPEQHDFLERVAGGWSGGRLWGTFTGAVDVALAAVKAITNASAAGKSAELAPKAQDRARATLTVSSSGFGTGSVVRVALVPLVERRLLDAVALDDRTLGSTIAELVRVHHLVGQEVGIQTTVSREGVHVAPTSSHGNAAAIALVGVDGTVMVEIAVGGTGTFGTMRVVPDRLRVAVKNAGAFALAAWARIDPREEVQQVAVAAAIPDAQSKVFGADKGENSMSMGWGLPQTVYAPDPATIVRRADVGSDRVARQVVAEVKRIFADARAVDE